MTGFNEEPSQPLRAPQTCGPVVTGRAALAAELTVDLRPVESLAANECDAMWELYSRFYAGSSCELFLSDLRAKRIALSSPGFAKA